MTWQESQSKPSSALPEMKVQGFKTCGLWPFDPNVFSDIDFEGALVTEEQMAEQEVRIPDTRAPEPPSDIIYTSN